MAYPRVTEVLNLLANFSAVREEIMYEAQIRGTRVHEACLSYAAGYMVPDLPDEYRGYFESFKKWFDEHVECVIYAEGFIFTNGNGKSGRYVGHLQNELFGYQGRPDIGFRFRGSPENVLGDIKTSQARSKLWQMQLAAYEMLFEGVGIQVSRRVTIRLKPDGSGVILPREGNEYEDPRYPFMHFTNLLNVYNFIR
jgi:hypothetical protein